ncbi:MAG: Mur ligase domain-containing protein [Kiritimatiellia bacterium]
MVKRIHIVGIGGVGMSAVAQALLDGGVVVSGSDRLLDTGDSTPVLECLDRQGVRLFPQNGSGVDAAVERVVISSAIENDNPDYKRAVELNISVEHRSRALKRIVSGRELVAVTGTCGKSSVTAMLGTVLASCGFDPLVVNGAAVTGWDDGNTRVGSVRRGAGIAIIEADESDRSLMNFSPEYAIITNASADHFNLQETLSLFDDFRKKVGAVVIDGLNDDDTEGLMQCSGLGGSFVFEGHEYSVPVPGVHNVRNARHAVRMALALGAAPEKTARALSGFRGVERRLQIVGECNGAVVIDDYAHNPEKLSAAWRTLADAFPGGVCGLWRPHGYAPLRKMMDDLVYMFASVCSERDKLILLPVYDAGGTTERDVNSEDLASKLKAEGVKVELLKNLGCAEKRMRELSCGFGVLAGFGARDPGLPRLAARLAE